MSIDVKLSEQVSLSPIVAGCMRMANENMSAEQILSFVHECMDMGVHSFDHAPVYGNYTVEKMFGDAVLRKDPTLRKQMRLVSKTGIVKVGLQNNRTVHYNSSPSWILPEVERSLQNLGTDHLDLLLVHRFDPLASPAELGAALDSLVHSGKVLNIGVSNYTPAALSALQAHMKARIVTNQIELSAKVPTALFDGQADYALLHNMPLMAWSPLGGGSIFTGQDVQSLRIRAEATQIASAHNTRVDTVLYAWLMRLPVAVLPVSGSCKAARVRSAMDAVNIQLSYDDWYSLLAASRGFNVP